MQNKNIEIVQQLFHAQKFGVLSTESDRHPYCNLIAFTPSDDCTSLVFATPRSTNKYTNLVKNPNVAFLIDNRSQLDINVKAGLAVTAIGHVTELKSEQADFYRRLHSRRHTCFEEFINLPDCALFQLHIEKYIIARGIDRISSLALT